jgi:hypothetical protein
MSKVHRIGEFNMTPRAVLDRAFRDIASLDKMLVISVNEEGGISIDGTVTGDELAVLLVVLQELAKDMLLGDM